MTEFHTSDRQLWADAVAGGEASFAMLFKRHVRAVYNHSFRLTGSWADAEDVSQQVFLAAWRRRSEVTLVADSALPWLLATATLAARGYQRSTRRWLAALRRLPPERSSGEDLADDAVGRVDDERRMHQLLRAVNRLPRGEREALVLCVWSGVSYRDAAAVLNIAEPSLRSRISRARARLARLLGTDTAPLTMKEDQS
jgi:RNA polymerase sigma-70 factor (ECF subfamily)